MNEKIKKKWALTAVLSLCITQIVFAQSGVNGLNTATTTLKTYVAPVTNITLVIGGIVGIVGAIRVYSKWKSSGFHPFGDLRSEIVPPPQLCLKSFRSII